MSQTLGGDSAPPRPFSFWVIGVWVMLLFAVTCVVQYLRGAEYLYVAAAILIIAVCAGCLLRQAWARPTMQAAAILLVLYALVTGVQMLQQWGEFDAARQHALTQPQPLSQLSLWVIDRTQRTWQVGLALRAIAMPWLLWLAWRLGVPTVRAQFRRRR